MLQVYKNLTELWGSKSAVTDVSCTPWGTAANRALQGSVQGPLPCSAIGNDLQQKTQDSPAGLQAAQPRVQLLGAGSAQSSHNGNQAKMKFLTPQAPARDMLTLRAQQTGSSSAESTMGSWLTTLRPWDKGLGSLQVPPSLLILQLCVPAETRW